MEINSVNNKDRDAFSKHSFDHPNLPLVKCNRRLRHPILIDRYDPVDFLKSQNTSTRGGHENKIANNNDNTLVI